jgi:hypothetical protein
MIPADCTANSQNEICKTPVAKSIRIDIGRSFSAVGGLVHRARPPRAFPGGLRRKAASAVDNCSSVAEYVTPQKCLSIRHTRCRRHVARTVRRRVWSSTSMTSASSLFRAATSSCAEAHVARAGENRASESATRDRAFSR